MGAVDCKLSKNLCPYINSYSTMSEEIQNPSLIFSNLTLYSLDFSLNLTVGLDADQITTA